MVRKRDLAKRWVVVALLLSLLAGRAGAQELEHQLVEADAAVINAWPGADGLIGTMDDVVDATPSTTNMSAPNSLGSYSYNAFDFVGDGSVTDGPKFPTGTQAITFLEGTVTVDTAVAAAGGGPIITNWVVSGTEPFAFHGPYTASITAVNGGTYDPLTYAFTLDVDFEANLLLGTGSVSNMLLSGEAYYLEASDFSATGNAYVDGVLIPLAQSRGASTLFFATGSGVVPPSTGAPLPEVPVEAALMALTVPEPSQTLATVLACLLLLGWRSYRVILPQNES